jgi:hypothetical protein
MNLLEPSDKYYIPDILTIRNAAFCNYGFCALHIVNSDYFLKQYYPVDICSGEV